MAISSKPIDLLNNQALVFFVFENRSLVGESARLVDNRLNGVISQSIEDKRITGIYGENVLVASEEKFPATKILLIGLGEASSLMYERLRKASATAYKTLVKLHVFDFAAFLPVVEVYNYDYSRIVEIFLDGIISGVVSMGYAPETTVTIVNEGEREDEITLGLNRVRSTYMNKVRVLRTEMS